MRGSGFWTLFLTGAGPLLDSGREYLPACGGSAAKGTSPQAEAPLLGTDFPEVHRRPLVQTPDAREYLLFDLTCLVRGNEVSFCAGEAHWAIRLLAGIPGFLGGIGPIPRDYGERPHLSVMFVTKRLQTVC